MTMWPSLQSVRLLGAAAFCALGCSARAALPTPDHVVVVIFENHTYSGIIGNPDAPNFTALAAAAANIRNWPDDPLGTNSGAHALYHPSEPNYLEFYSGTNHGVIGDGYPGPPDEPLAPIPPFDQPNLGAGLRNAGFSFASYSQSLPYAGFDGVAYTTVPNLGQYERKHNPVANWMNSTNPTGNYLPPSVNQPFTAFQAIGAGPGRFANLPTVCFVIPDQQNNMHDGSIAQGDAWLKTNILDTYLTWAQTNNSLLVVTFDENDEGSPSNLIPLLFAGPMIKPGNYFEMNINVWKPQLYSTNDPGTQTPTGTALNHHNVLATLLDLYGLERIGGSIARPAISDVFVTPQPQLNIVATGPDAAKISWHYPCIGFALQQSPDPYGTNWVAPSETVTNDGTNYSLLISPLIGSRFYRLMAQ